MQLKFDAQLLLDLPETSSPNQQNIYFFNLYRSGSSVVEAVALAFAKHFNRTPFNLTAALYKSGVEYFHTGASNGNSLYLSRTRQLVQLCDFGGYLFYGFREVPLQFAQAFRHIGAATLTVRDPRDIGISHYYAVSKHLTDNSVLEKHIKASRESVEMMKLEEYLLSDATTSFLNRICLSYAPMIRAGLRPLHYEDLFLDGKFSVAALCDEVYSQLAPYKSQSFDMAELQAYLGRLIDNSKALKGHETSGSTRNYEKLPPSILRQYSNKLAASLDLLNY